MEEGGRKHQKSSHGDGKASGPLEDTQACVTLGLWSPPSGASALSFFPLTSDRPILWVRRLAERVLVLLMTTLGPKGKGERSKIPMPATIY